MANASVIDALMITLGIDTSGVKSGMASAENIIANSAKNIMNNILAPLATALALGSAFKNYISNASSLSSLSETLNENEEDIQAWSGAVERAGGDASSFEGSLLSLNSKMLEFSQTGTSSAAPTLVQLGISARDANGKIKSSIDIMQDLSRVAKTMDASRFQALTSSLGIDSGTLSLLKQGTKSVDELIARQKLLGVYTKEDGEIATKMGNAIKDLIQVLKSISTIIMRFVLPPLTYLTNKMVDFVIFIKEHEVFLRAVIIGIAAVLSAVLLPAITKIGAAMLTNPLTWIFIGIATAVLAVSALIEDLYVYIQGGQSAFAGFWAIFGSGTEIAEKLSKIWTKIKDVASKFIDMAIKNFKIFLKIIGNIIELILTFASYLGYIAQMIKSLFTFDGESLKKAFEGFLVAGEAIVNIFIRIISYIKDMFLNFLEFLGIKDAVISFFNKIGEVASATLGKITNFLSPVIDGFKSIGNGIFNFFGSSDAKPSDALPNNINNSNRTITTTSSVNVGEIIVQSNSADPKEVAKEIPNAMNNYNTIAPANSAVGY